MCQQRNIVIINHTDTINISKQLNECLFHLNRCGAYECFKSFKKFSCNLHWRDVDNSGSLGHYEAIIPEFVKDMFHCGHNEVLTENGNEVSNLCSEYNNNDGNNIKDDLVGIDPAKVLNNFYQKHSSMLVIS